VDQQFRAEGTGVAALPVGLLAEDRNGRDKLLDLCDEGAIAVPETQALPFGLGLAQVADEEAVERPLQSALPAARL
jgi:hypothetical protein